MEHRADADLRTIERVVQRSGHKLRAVPSHTNKMSERSDDEAPDERVERADEVRGGRVPSEPLRDLLLGDVSERQGSYTGTPRAPRPQRATQLLDEDARLSAPRCSAGDRDHRVAVEDALLLARERRLARHFA